MQSLHLLIKPVSNNCNIDCKYCFYKDISSRRHIANYGFMSLETLKMIVIKAFKDTKKNITFAFQGGEPLLIGIEFYQHFFKLVEKYNVNNIQVNCVVQTNGMLLNEQFVTLFKKHNVLVGVSIDGPTEIHDLFRVDYKNMGSFKEVMSGINLLKKYKVEFNILTVVTKYVAKNIKEIYKFYNENKFYYVQFIEALDFNFTQTGKEVFSLNNEDYYQFLSDLFVLWYDDLFSGKAISIRIFEDMIRKKLHINNMIPCYASGVCQNQNVIEANGDIFSCDFYVTDPYCIGNINELSFKEVMRSKINLNFIKESYNHPEECKTCEYYNLCRNGCKRYRVDNKYYYCEAVKKFYHNYLPELNRVTEAISGINV